MLAVVSSLAAVSFLAPPAVRLNGAAPRAAVRMAKGNEAIDFPELDGSEVRIGIVRARWHDEACSNLVDGVKEALKECGVNEENIVESEVPGSFELPLASRYLALSGTVDAVIPIGVLVKGDTYHFEVIADTVTRGLMDIGLSTGVPIIYGVLTCNTEQQVTDRSTGSNNHGYQWGKAAVEMSLLRASAIGRKNRKFFLGFGAEEDMKSESSKDGAKIGF